MGMTYEFRWITRRPRIFSDAVHRCFPVWLAVGLLLVECFSKNERSCCVLARKGSDPLPQQMEVFGTVDFKCIELPARGSGYDTCAVADTFKCSRKFRAFSSLPIADVLFEVTGIPSASPKLNGDDGENEGLSKFICDVPKIHSHVNYSDAIPTSAQLFHTIFPANPIGSLSLR